MALLSLTQTDIRFYEEFVNLMNKEITEQINVKTKKYDYNFLTDQPFKLFDRYCWEGASRKNTRESNLTSDAVSTLPSLNFEDLIIPDIEWSDSE